ncbi:hypothetical protein DICSQDRAFT_50371 [Dichomitus squalens LYAD-421 SS1]|uniref:uncharacterized protein n=1 Tax=Dichomitus squalens (strain LYAD-421) TaxID=732165 RepID=UPI000441623F|nr:uncharacterized protein DICSQDRAFT_50371 [Dichomitus squalens LYAD-421 SS1]EJF65198.1 hypothetical protein DICSQDRAFT_50371 [Dichomitus squalens LYAD-421 SS1]
MSFVSLFQNRAGYIGCGVLNRILSDGKAADFQITVLIRDAAKASKLEPFGVKTVVGSLEDTDELTALAGEADLVFNCADADNIQPTKAILAGLRKRHQSTGRVPSLIHTGRSIGVLADDATGMYLTETVYSDDDVDPLYKLPITAPHQEVNKAILEADQEGYIRSYLVLPPAVWGLAQGPLVDAHIMNPQSQEIPALIIASIDRGRPGMVGEGKNVWSNVHIDDAVLLYELIWNAILGGEEIGHGSQGYYFPENGEHQLYDVSKAIGAGLKDLRLVEDPEPSSFTTEELDKYFDGVSILLLGSNSRCRGQRARAIRWNPRKTTEDMLASIKPEIQYMLSRAS